VRDTLTSLPSGVVDDPEAIEWRCRPTEIRSESCRSCGKLAEPAHPDQENAMRQLKFLMKQKTCWGPETENHCRASTVQPRDSVLQLREGLRGA
jgi:hypothetical protein